MYAIVTKHIKTIKLKTITLFKTLNPYQTSILIFIFITLIS